MKKYVRVMDGLQSNAGGFQYKLDEVNVASNWNPNSEEPDKMGGFNFGTYDKILRWTHRGDTLYDVIVPDDAEVVLCNEIKGVYRTNKIIVTNPRKITDDLIWDIYLNTDLPNDVMAQCLQVLIWRGRLNVAKNIVLDRVNKENVDEYLESFIKYISDGKEFSYESVSDEDKEIIDLFNNIKNQIRNNSI